MYKFLLFSIFIHSLILMIPLGFPIISEDVEYDNIEVELINPIVKHDEDYEFEIDEEMWEQDFSGKCKPWIREMYGNNDEKI